MSAGRPERALAAGAAAAAALLLAGGAAAGTASCMVSTAPVAFGAYDAGSDSDASGYIDVSCTCVSGNDCTDLPYTLEIQPGASGSTSPRRMGRGGGPETLDYDLYQDGARTMPWSTGAEAVGRTYGQALYDVSQRTHVYGRAPNGQHVPADTYGETPAVTMTY